MEGLRKEPLFGPTADDDVNLVDSADSCDSDSDADDDGILEDNEVITSSLEGANDVEDVPMTEDVSEAELLGFTEDALRDIAGNGWVTYDEEHSEDFQVDAAADYYDGEFGSTRSAVAYEDSPLRMFFYFLPKELWSHIAKETNRYRTQNITVIATSRRNKLLAWQAKDPRIIQGYTAP
ncbi:uncharacterized protein PITG_15014 [Phytophthora infestans T30-4]|uniref:Uncharacterized protein n=1 Tax=Phytophthora infestans (strain T30-4) TaxID=403677 RepID=D0NRG2_PHYIT|nr:uncharacterized protein PITG_15014 [Phytophthora infestans T30-4]EEY63312.1 conserved hypothetical protein [Phytophthora infestans T30-4]|eukprot:XP_002898197.1 conserved hypothetical protein [Phytophthora infestans T30-4]